MVKYERKKSGTILSLPPM